MRYNSAFLKSKDLRERARFINARAREDCSLFASTEDISHHQQERIDRIMYFLVGIALFTL